MIFCRPKTRFGVFECFDIFGLCFTSRFLEKSKISASENVQKMTFELFSKIQVFGKIKKVTTRIQIANQTTKSPFKITFWNLWNILIDKKKPTRCRLTIVVSLALSCSIHLLFWNRFYDWLLVMVNFETQLGNIIPLVTKFTWKQHYWLWKTCIHWCLALI